MAVLLDEDLLLLLLDDEDGTLPGSFGRADTWTEGPATTQEVVLGAAVLAELVLVQAVTLRESGEPDGFHHRAVVTPQAFAPGGPREDDVLRVALGLVDRAPLRPVDLVVLLGAGLPDAVLGRLAGRGMLRGEDRRAFGLVPRTRWRPADRRYEDGIQQRLLATLVGGVAADPRTATLVALLAAVNHYPEFVTRTRVPKPVLRARSARVAAGCWPAAAAQEALARLGAQATARFAADLAVATAAGAAAGFVAGITGTVQEQVPEA